MDDARDPATEHGGGVRLILSADPPDDKGGRQGVIIGVTGERSETITVPRGRNGFDLRELATQVQRARGLDLGTAETDSQDFGFLRLTGHLVSAAPAPEGEAGRLDALAAAIPRTTPAANGPTVPAAYTYFGQFVAHELTLGRVEGWEARGSRLDLASLGLGRRATRGGSEQEVGKGIWLGRTTANKLRDLPRAPGGAPQVADERNDHNLALAQMHVAVARFAAACGGIAKALPLVQEVALWDWLGRVCDPAVHACVMANGRVLVAPDPAPNNAVMSFVLPEEVATAALRFGHAMVRDKYQPWNLESANSNHQIPSALLWDLLKYTNRGVLGVGLTGPLEEHWTAEWSRLGTNGTNQSFPLSPMLGPAIRALPRGAVTRPFGDGAWIDMVRQTLLRGHERNLATGQEVVRWANHLFHHANPPRAAVPLLDENELTGGDSAVAQALRNGNAGERLLDRTPLWFYLMREAAAKGLGLRLGPLGSRLVAEAVHAACEAAPCGVVVPGKPVRVSQPPVTLDHLLSVAAELRC